MGIEINKAFDHSLYVEGVELKRVVQNTRIDIACVIKLDWCERGDLNSHSVSRAGS